MPDSGLSATVTRISRLKPELENLIVEAQEYAAEIDYKQLSLTEFRREIDATGIDLTAAMGAFVSTYRGRSGELIAMRSRFAEKGYLTPGQAKEVFNIMSNELRDGRQKYSPRQTFALAAPVQIVERTEQTESEPSRALPIPTSAPEPASDAHEIHDPADLAALGALSTERPVVVGNKSVFDLSSIPDGYYAFFDNNRRQDWMFLEVRTIKRVVTRRKHFESGKYVVGAEKVAPGTIEVRQINGDTKRLAGYQKPGTGYQGEYLPELVAISGAPGAWGQLYGRMIGCCGICGKQLTDEKSRTRTIGPNCAELWDTKYWQDWDREVMLADAEKKRQERAAAKAAGKTVEEEEPELDEVDE